MSTPTQPRRDNEDYGDQILSKAVKAGRRTYFFDVRATRGDDWFLTITESRKITAPDGSSSYDRHKIFLYKEDFTKFSEGLGEVVEFIRRSKGIPEPVK
ncbi:MAG TPA: PUR family DNA/RNA-binding protein [Candidatus Alistipes intestinigallinarum]|uniref:PUR family DNA/RNA-binding protein n=1 Tax=Candidatus Alistipes intestinigallinarum TaxID=2838440 RepID=A0A9D2CBI1_9BACT|nr:PUR family DNA/RNA-binding protein [Candidatus Alistipes intestinigallinarum]